ncbi:MAG TPA: hypothetical protein VL117_14540 [Thermoleophilia bacterium]|nr:hypothetical protein [Thermoleophilia bacterium]
MALRRDRLAYAAALAAANPAPADTAPSPAPGDTASPSPAPADTAPSPAPGDTTAATPAPSASPCVAAVVSAPVLTPEQWHRVVLRAQRRVRVLAGRVTRLRCELSLRRAAARGNWMPLVRDAARHNRISAVGLRRLMSLESGGRAHAENGSYHGLYQYCWSTWRAAWNPWRSASLYNGEAQIRATALAIRRGWGASMWPNTYPRAF